MLALVFAYGVLCGVGLLATALILLHGRQVDETMRRSRREVATLQLLALCQERDQEREGQTWN
jgi:hypothetical protein